VFLKTLTKQQMTELESPCLLCIGLPVPTDGPDGTYVQAESGYQALELARFMRFDLLVVTVGTLSMSLNEFLRRMRERSREVKWVLVSTPWSSPIRPEDELLARSNGVLAVLDLVQGLDDLLELARSIRRRSGSSLVLNMSAHEGV
jgi:DNA-binding response OmpR family regulator